MMTRIPSLAVFAFLIVAATCNKASVTTYIKNKKFSCPDVDKKIYKAASEMQCVHKCLRYDKCTTINYNAANDAKENCEVFSSSSCSTTAISSHWTGIVIQQTSSEPKVYDSCKEIFSNGAVTSGVYRLKSGLHFCNMSNVGSCGGGGWTLAMKVDGSKTTFKASSAYWTNNEIFDVENGIKSFYENEAKFPAFNNVSFDEMCIGMNVASAVNWIKLPINAASLLAIFKPGTFVQTRIGRSTWKSLIASSSLQLNCNHEGLNVKNSGNMLMTRIGIIANQENECASPDSFVGLGGIWSSCCNKASLSPDNGDKNTLGMGYILVR
ncbi:uncharacterized protein LOC135687256 isoform X2 [Rhopilema esculentum]|uniref:uncharacterized protein LOC135687256 isoform X2 n=1 Tax=Rhopilema esculentum TaxID=499914 RepID=UPI0031E39E25